MDYFNKDSIMATQRSYNEALDKLLTLCPNVEPTMNEYNSRVVSPISWRPVFGSKKDNLIQYVNCINVSYEQLFDFGKPKVILNNYTIWKERWLNLYCAIQFPFNIYGWESARQEYPKGYDENDNPIGKSITIPATMSEWNSPHYLTLEVYDGVWDKGWGLKDWHLKYDEISNFGKVFDDIKTQARYMEGIAKADAEVEKWEQAMAKLQTMLIPQKIDNKSLNSGGK